MRITLDEVISRHKKVNPNTDYDYTETVLGQTLHSKVIIVCPIHGAFKQAPHEHMKGQGCPKCGIESLKKTKTTDVEVMIENSIKLFGDRFDYTKTRETYKKYKTECIFHCNRHNIDFSYKPIDHMKSKVGGCALCRRELFKTDEERKKEQLEKELIKQAKLFKKEQILKQKEELKRKREEERQLKKKLQEELKEIKREKYRKRYNVDERKKVFIKKLTTKYGNKFDTSFMTEYVNSQTKVQMYCKEKDENGNEHGIFHIRPIVLLQYGKCPKCSKNKRRTAEELYNELNEIHNNMYEYTDLENKIMKKYIAIHCKRCGLNFTQKLNDHINGHGCPYCRRSRLETELENFLNKNNIFCLMQTNMKVFKWLGRQSFDFYLPDYNIAIECQGSQHFEVREAFGGYDGFVKCQQRDVRKKQLCKENNVHLIYYLDKRFEKYMTKDDVYFTDKNDLFNYIKNFH